MATANTIELETCMAQCLRYCESNPEQEFVEYHYPRLVRANQRYTEIVAKSDRKYVDWKREEREDKIAWKKLAGRARQIQRELKRINAVDYPTERVYHWDEEILVAFIGRLLTYLKGRKDSIAAAAGYVEELERILEKAQSEEVEEGDALEDYRRFAVIRSQSFGGMASALSGFRESMRRYLGTSHEDYAGIRWPVTLNPDESVL